MTVGSAALRCAAINEFGKEALVMCVDRKLNSTDVIEVLTDLFIPRSSLGYVRDDNGPVFVAKAVRAWIEAVGAQTDQGRGDVESFDVRFHHELLNGETFASLTEVKIVNEVFPWHHDTTRPHLAVE